MPTFRADLAAAWTAWIEDAKRGTEERKRRAKARGFLTYEDSDGRFLDFHALPRQGYRERFFETGRRERGRRAVRRRRGQGAAGG